LASLGLAEHFRENEARAYINRLKSQGDEGFLTATELTLPLGGNEARAFSYGALYHPWLIGREEDLLLRTTPPDGASIGIIARRAIERGAWIAPANEQFRGVVILSPLLNPARRLDLLLLQLNQIQQEPNGFLTLNSDTLSNDPDLRPINVRRLLILLRRAALRLGMTYVFEPNGPSLRRMVQRAFESLMDQLFMRGAFAGATRATSYQVVPDDTVNPPENVDQGRFQVDLRIAPSLPMSFVTVRLVQLGENSFVMEIV
jgi:phage tail sheath protein FI